MVEFEYKHPSFSETSAAAPAIASQAFDQASLLAWRGNRNSANLSLALLGRNLDITSKLTLAQETSLVGPSLCNFKGRWVMAWSGMDANHTLNVALVQFDSDNHVTGVTGKQYPGSTDFSPALAASEDALYVAWAGRDGGHTINVAQSVDGLSFGPPRIWSDHSSTHSPGLAVHNGRGLLAYVDLQGQLVLVEMDTLGNPLPGYPHKSGDTSSLDVEVASWGEKFAVAWTGDGGHKLNVAIHDPRQPSFVKTTYSDSGSFGPSLSWRRLRQDPHSNVPDTDQLLIAWTGTDGAGTLTVAIIASQDAQN